MLAKSKGCFGSLPEIKDAPKITFGCFPSSKIFTKSETTVFSVF
jgi:hypothetical protein